MSRIAAAVVSLALASSLFATSSLALQIEKVGADRLRFEPAKGESLRVAFRIDAPAEVALQLYDDRELRIREVRSVGRLPAGEHALVWDGRDEAGRAAPPEAYHFTLRAKGAEDAEVVYDVTDRTGGETVNAGAMRYDREAKTIRYVLPQLARVNVRVGLLNGGPLLRTLLDWVPRQAGERTEAWDGKDGSGVLDLANHGELAVVVSAYALPENTVLLGPPANEVSVIERMTWKAAERPNRLVRPSKQGDYASQMPEARRDVAVALELPAEIPRNAQGHPVVTKPTPVRFTVPDARDAERMLAERFELAFFLDGQYRFEHEAGFLPATWLFDPAGVSPGTHYLTGNLLGYEGHFGIATLRIEVRAADEGDASEERGR